MKYLSVNTMTENLPYMMQFFMFRDVPQQLQACRARLLSKGRASVERNIYTENEASAGHAFGAFACGGFAVRTGDLDDPIQCTCVVVVETHVW